MAVLVDSYSETNVNVYVYLSSTEYWAAGQSFTGNGGTLNSCKFYLTKFGSPTGNATAKIYTHSGTFGTSSISTGSALAVSDNFDVSTLSTYPTVGLKTFTFSGANKITLTDETYYIVTVEYNGGNVSNDVDVGTDNSSLTHGGNMTRTTDGTTWTATSGTDVAFYVYTDDPTTTSTTSTTSTSISTTSSSISTSTTSSSSSISTSTTSSSSSTSTTSSSSSISTTSSSSSISTTSSTTSSSSSISTTSSSSSISTTSSSSSSSSTSTTTVPVTIYIRGQATPFSQDDASPAWELYSAPTQKANWRYLQVKLSGS